MSGRCAPAHPLPLQVLKTAPPQMHQPGSSLGRNPTQGTQSPALAASCLLQRTGACTIGPSPVGKDHSFPTIPSCAKDGPAESYSSGVSRNEDESCCAPSPSTHLACLGCWQATSPELQAQPETEDSYHKRRLQPAGVLSSNCRSTSGWSCKKEIC